MSDDQKLFIRKMWITFVTAVIVQLVAALFAGFIILNRGHYQTINNSKDIKDLEGDVGKLEYGMRYDYVTKDNFMNYLELMEKKNKLLETAFIELREDHNAENVEIRAEIRSIDDRIADIMMNYSRRGPQHVESLLNSP